METPKLTKEQIEYAKQDRSHPVVQILDSDEDFIKHFNEGYKKVRGDNKKVYSFVSEMMWPIALKINALEEFSFEPLDIVSIWSRIDESFQPTGYFLSRNISTAYSIDGIGSPRIWVDSFQEISEQSGVPEPLLSDKDNVLNFYRRIEEIRRSLGEVELYRTGTREMVPEIVER